MNLKVSVSVVCNSTWIFLSVIVAVCTGKKVVEHLILKPQIWAIFIQIIMIVASRLCFTFVQTP